MEPTRRDYDADYMTVVYAYAEGEATKLQVDGALTLYCAAVAGLPPTPTPHRSPEDIGLERGAVGVPLAERRACWSCRHAPTLDECTAPFQLGLLDWIADNIDNDGTPVKSARDCPGYEDRT